VARFVVLKKGVSYSVFEFDGNIARVGGGSNVDLTLSDTEFDGDICFLTKISSGYELEPRVEESLFSINGKPITGRTVLAEGDKIAFADYLIVVTYQTDGETTKPEELQKSTPDDMPTVTVATQPPKKDTVPVKKGSEKVTSANITPPDETDPAKPVQEPSSKETPKSAQQKEEPAPKVNVPAVGVPGPKGSEQATTMLNLDNVPPPPKAARPKSTPQPQKPVQPPAQEQKSPSTIRIHTPKPEPDKQEPVCKPKIKPIYSLVCLSGQHKGLTIDIDCEDFVFGRDRACDLVVERDEKGHPEGSISREHFSLLTRDEGLYLIDRRSKLRTMLNGQNINSDQRELVVPEDIISIPAPSGEIKFRVCFCGEESFVPDDREKSNTRLVLILASIVIILIIVAVWLLMD